MSINALIPPDEKDAYECIVANRMNLFRFVKEFATSVALFEFLERGGGPPSAGVLGGKFTMWRMIAARDGALNIYHFGCSLAALKKQLPACATLNQHVDSEAIRNTLKTFRRYFPNASTIRHTIAHAGEMQKSPSTIRRHTQRTDKTWHGGSSAAGGLLLESIYERTYSVGKEGDVFSLTLDQQAIDRLAEVRRLVEAALDDAIKSLQNTLPLSGS